MTRKSSGVVHLTETFPVSAERVFDAWLSPEKVARWFGFADAEECVTRVEIDARIGGAIRVTTKRAGRTVEHTGEYLEIRRPHRLSFTLRSSASPRTARVAVRIEPRGAGCILTLTSTIEPAPLHALASFVPLETCQSQKTARCHWPSLEGKAALSLGLHLAMLPLLPIILRDPPPPARAMLAVDLAATEAVQQPAPAQRAPRATATTHAARQPVRAARASAGALGDDNEALRQRARAVSAQDAENLVGTSCVGTIDFPPDVGSELRVAGQNSAYYGGQTAPAQGRFFRDQAGRTWIRFTLWPGAPWNLPVTIAGSEVRWTGVYGNNFVLRLVGNNHLTGVAAFLSDSAAKVDFTCAGPDAHPT